MIQTHFASFCYCISVCCDLCSYSLDIPPVSCSIWRFCHWSMDRHATVLTRHAPSQGWRFQIELPWKMIFFWHIWSHVIYVYVIYVYMLFIVILYLYLCLCYWVSHLRIGNDNSNEEINENPSSLPVSQASILESSNFQSHALCLYSRTRHSNNCKSTLFKQVTIGIWWDCSQDY